MLPRGKKDLGAEAAGGVAAPAEGPPPGAAPAEPEPGFEEALGRLEDLVARLEGGDLDLEQSLALFQEGVRLHKLCARLLDVAEGRIKVLVEDGLGPRLEPWPGRAGGGGGREEEEE